jgi:hypothetical protein
MFGKLIIFRYIFRRFFICKNILKKLLCYHDNYFKYFTFGKYNGFVARVSACMYFLVIKVNFRSIVVLIFHEITYILTLKSP